MRVELYFKEGFVKREYPYLLYSNIITSSKYRDELHKGIQINEKNFSFMNISDFLRTKTIYDENRNVKGFQLRNSKVVVNCLNEEYLKDIINRLIENGLVIGDNTLFVDKVDIKNKDLSEYPAIYDCYIKTLSPILVHNRKNDYIFYNPFEEYFYASIKRNLLLKTKLLNFNIEDEIFEMEPIKIERAPRYYKAMDLVAYHGIFKIKCNRELLQTALTLGLGQKSSVFGCIDIVEEGEISDLL